MQARAPRWTVHQMPAALHAPAASVTQAPPAASSTQAPAAHPVTLRKASPRLSQAPATAPLHQAACVLTDVMLQSQKYILEAICKLTAEVRNVTGVLSDICCAIKDLKKYILCLTCP